MIVRRLATVAVAAVAVAGSTSACAVPAGPTGGPSQQPSATASASTKPADAAPVVDSRVRKVGQPYVYTDGVQMTITSVTRWQHTYPEPGKAYFCVTVKITNGSKKILDSNSAQINVKTGADGEATEYAPDSSKNASGFFDAGSIAPGRAQTTKTPVSMPTGTSLSQYSVELAPGYGYEPVIFEGSLK